VTELVVKTPPYKYQKKALADAVGKHKNLMLNADPGLGKTKITIDIAATLYRAGEITDLWIVAPNNVHAQWIEEQFPTHSAVDYTALLYNAGKWNQKGYQRDVAAYKATKGMLRVFSVNLETFAIPSGVNRLREMWKNTGPRVMLAVDESSRFKNPVAKRWKTVAALARHCTKVITMTGTPINNSPFDLWGQYELLKDSFFGLKFHPFKHRYGILIRQEAGGKSFTTEADDRVFSSVRRLMEKGFDDDYIAARTGIGPSSINWLRKHPEQTTPYKNLEELKAKIAPYTIQIRKEDVAKDLPEKVFAPVYATLTAEQTKVYKELVKEHTSRYGDHECSLTQAMTLTMRLQQVTGGFFPVTDPLNEGARWVPFEKNPKLDQLLSDIADSPRESIIIWAEFRAEIEAIGAALRKEYKTLRTELYYGGTPGNARAGIKDAFIAGDVNFFVAHRKSAGIGLNLQRSSLMYFYSNGFTLEDRIQSEDRIHRIGQRNAPVYKDVYIKGTIDDKIRQRFIQRKELADDFRHLDRLIEYSL